MNRQTLEKSVNVDTSQINRDDLRRSINEVSELIRLEKKIRRSSRTYDHSKLFVPKADATRLCSIRAYLRGRQHIQSWKTGEETVKWSAEDFTNYVETESLPWYLERLEKQNTQND